MERIVKKFGNSGHVVVPKKMISKKVTIDEVTQMYREMDEDTNDAITRGLSGDVDKNHPYYSKPLFSDDELIKMDVTKARKRPPYSDFSKKLKTEIGKFIDKFRGKKINAEQLSKFIALLNRDLTAVLKKGARKYFRKIYSLGMEDVGKELDVNIGWGKVDSNAIEALTNQRVLSRAYQGITDKVTFKINNIIRQAISNPEKFTIGDITEKIKDVSDVADYRAENIARTETSRVSNTARLNSYKKEDGENLFKYKWIGPNDRRTTDLSKRIKARTVSGVSYEELVKIVTEESFKDFPEWQVNPDGLVSHYQSRHLFVRTG